MLEKQYFPSTFGDGDLHQGMTGDTKIKIELFKCTREFIASFSLFLCEIRKVYILYTM